MDFYIIAYYIEVHGLSRLAAGLHPDPLGSLCAPQTPWLQWGPISKDREVKGGGGGRGPAYKGRDGRGGVYL